MTTVEPGSSGRQGRAVEASGRQEGERHSCGPRSAADAQPDRAGPARRASAPGAGDCRFLAECLTYRDPLVPRRLKGSAGHGCTGQTDTYRKRHCKTFACKMLSCLLGALLARPADR